jgi:hypothetical protein
MFSPRLGIAIAAVAIAMAAAPSAAHAQFGGLGKLKKAKEMFDKGKALKAKADSAKALVNALKGKSTVEFNADGYDRFATATAAERAAIAANDAKANETGAAAGKFSADEYTLLKLKATAYVEAKTKNQQIPEGIFSEDEIKLLDGKGSEAVAKLIVGTK